MVENTIALKQRQNGKSSAYTAAAETPVLQKIEKG